MLDNQQRGVVCLTFFSLLFLVGVGAPSFVSHDPVGLDNFNDKESDLNPYYQRFKTHQLEITEEKNHLFLYQLKQ